ncbi:histidinol-phosphatase HisJ family protein [Patescibacteria group bacterium]|nr:histidinol-phosphatase HisJ family protein [Patescibacteria group bacterium]
MYLVDYHVHTNCTRDATGTVDDYCKRAQELGLKEIAFTNHLILPKFESIPGFEKSEIPNISIKLDEISEYYQKIGKARKQFDIQIKFGMEIDYFEDYEKEIEKIINSYPFDFILGSAHFIEGYVIGDPNGAHEFFKGRDIFQTYRQYFLKLKRAIESRLFDVMAHPDIIRKYAVQYADIPFKRYRDQVEEVVKALVKNKVGIELNTYGYIHPVHDSYPSIEFLKICKDFGVKMVTIGSDAHSPSNLGLELEKGIKKLKSAGYDKITLFNQREARELSII